MIAKGSERYIFLYEEAKIVETLRVFGRYASNPKLSFTEYDAAVATKDLRTEYKQKLKQIIQATYEEPVSPTKLESLSDILFDGILASQGGVQGA